MLYLSARHSRYLIVLMFLLILALVGCQAAIPEAAAPSPAQEAEPMSTTSTIDIYHFTDYHCHALPAFAEGDPSRGGIARVVGLIEEAKANNDNVLAFSGGDMMNFSNPVWSDAYTCIEWGWFNNTLDGMAVGNHEFDYGPDIFANCANHITYPIISSGLVVSDTMEFYLPEYKVYDVDGVKVGVFAVVGDDYPRIVKPELVPEGTRWLTGEEKLARAAEIVDILRNDEKVDVVISIGHQSNLEDEAMAQAIPGINLILGTHSHLKISLTQIDGTETYYISPFQYVDYVSHVVLNLEEGQLAGIEGDLIPINSSTPENAAVAANVNAMQIALEAQYPERFEVLGEASVLIDNEGINLGETGIGNFITDLAREAVEAYALLSTSSSFRAAMPPGPITQEMYLTALPNANMIVTAEMSGTQLLDLLALSAGKRGSDTFSQISGLRYTVDAGNNSVSEVQVMADPTDPSAGYTDVDPDAMYLVSATYFQAMIAGGYKELFAAAENLTNTEIDINQLVIDYIGENSPVSAVLDGRVRVCE